MFNRATVYWLHSQEQINFFTEGYIGVSINSKKRLHQHKYLASKNIHENIHLANALKKYDIIQTTLLVGEETYCYQIEEKLRPEKNIGWNINKGGERPPSQKGALKSEDHKTKISKAHLLLKKTLSDELKLKLWKTRKGHSDSEETRLKRKNSCIGINLGVIRSPETREKVRQANLGKKRSFESIQKQIETTKKNKEKKCRSISHSSSNH